MSCEKMFAFYDELPQQLSKKETNELIELASKGSETARKKLATCNIRLVIYEVRKKFFSIDCEKSDLVSIGNIGLLKAINTFDVSKNYDFSTYAVRCIDNEILMFLRKNNKQGKCISLGDSICYSEGIDQLKIEDTIRDEIDLVQQYEKKELHETLKKLVFNLPDRDKKIIMSYFGFDNERFYKQDEIADMFNTSQPYISRLISKIVKKLGNQLSDASLIDFHSKTKVLKKED